MPFIQFTNFPQPPWPKTSTTSIKNMMGVSMCVVKFCGSDVCILCMMDMLVPIYIVDHSIYWSANIQTFQIDVIIYTGHNCANINVYTMPS